MEIGGNGNVWIEGLGKARPCWMFDYCLIMAHVCWIWICIAITLIAFLGAVLGVGCVLNIERLLDRFDNGLISCAHSMGMDSLTILSVTIRYALSKI